MKPIWTGLLLAVLALDGCEEKVDHPNEGVDFDIAQDLQNARQQNQMPQLAARLGCTSCHALDYGLMGPAWKDVGKRYRNSVTFEYRAKTYPLVEGLVQKISHGGTGNWGPEVMPPIDPDGTKHEQIETLVRFILENGKR